MLTALTQIGGAIYIITGLFAAKQKHRKTLKHLFFFSLLYLLSTFFIVPILAPVFGREKIATTENLKSHSIFYILCNRNYVTPRMQDVLQQTAIELDKKHSGIKLIYLDANFPFIDNFPLLPHLSHDDGEKVDLTFLYSNNDGSLTNKKPSISGYGYYENPQLNEYDQASACIKKGYWQYDFPKYLTLGSVNDDILFSAEATKDLIDIITKQPSVKKIFIEPHLKARLNIANDKVRFHGCQAVRHDDHIHIQL